MSNVIPFEKNNIYTSHPERELEAIWQDIQGHNINNLSRNLMKAIAKNEDNVKTVDIPLYSKQMFDSKENKYVPFDIWGAIHIINVRNEKLVMRIYQPLPHQNELGEVLKGWQTYNCEHLQESLTEKSSTVVLDACSLIPMRPNLAAAHKLRSWLQGEHTKYQESRDKVNNHMISHPLFHTLQQEGKLK